MKLVLSNCSASLSELKRDPAAVLAAAGGAAVAILNHDEPTAYLVPADTYEWLLDSIEDADLAQTVRERQSQLDEAIEVDLDQL